MQYITTRSGSVLYSSDITLLNNLAPDGGHFIPAELPCFDGDAIAKLKEKTFGCVLAEVLNVFYPNQLSGWDVDFCIGRNVFRLISMNHRIAVAEMWHNLENEYAYITKQLYRKILNREDETASPTEWFKIVVRIAVNFGIYGELLKAELIHLNQKFDIAVPAVDFVAPIAAWYTRKMCLPIETIICTCGENSPVWDLIHRDSFNTALAGDALCLGIERLIFEAFGNNEAKTYITKCENAQIYSVNEVFIGILNSVFFCSVPGAARAASVISSVYRTNGYLMDPRTALCYGGLQDYRARTGDSRITVLFAEEDRLRYANEIAEASGVACEQITNQN